MIDVCERQATTERKEPESGKDFRKEKSAQIFSLFSSSSLQM